MIKNRMKKYITLLFVLYAGISLSDMPSFQRQVFVSSLPEVAVALSACPEAGQREIIIRNGTYAGNDYLRVIGEGSECRKITVKAETAGKVIIVGKAGFYLSGSQFITIEGLVFNNQEGTSAIVMEDCAKIRITQCQFKLSECKSPELKDERLIWVRVIGDSRDCRVDHCLFEEKTHRGNMVKVEGSEDGEEISQGCRIENNHFKNFYQQSGNGYETIVLGGAKWCHLSASTVVASNLFENCSGEAEIISLKSSGNILTGNTFLNCSGSVYIRIGHNNQVRGNCFINQSGKRDVNGVRVYGRNNKVINNYFEKVRFPVVVHGGYLGEVIDYQTDKKFKEYGSFFCAENAEIVSNAIVNCNYTVVLGGSAQGMIFREFGPLYHPVNTRVVRNYMVGRYEDVFKIIGAPENTLFADNLYYDPEGTMPQVDDVYADGVVFGVPEQMQMTGVASYQTPLTPNAVGPDWFD